MGSRAVNEATRCADAVGEVMQSPSTSAYPNCGCCPQVFAFEQDSPAPCSKVKRPFHHPELCKASAAPILEPTRVREEAAPFPMPP